jgi:hypothetical protein
MWIGSDSLEFCLVSHSGKFFRYQLYMAKEF